MKYAIILASGMADEPLEDLGGRTPIEAAHAPALQELARDGKTGLVKTLPDDLPASEEVALLTLLGYAPHKYFTGEGALAAADAIGEMGNDRLALMHNLVTENQGRMVDHAAGQIGTREAEALLHSLSAALARPDVHFYVGRGFSGVTILGPTEGASPLCVPPEEVIGTAIEKHLPTGENSDSLRKLIELSREIFVEHEINRVRADLGENPANLLWPWGSGRKLCIPSFNSSFRLTAAMIAASPSARGIGKLAGMHVPTVAGATGDYRTDYAAKAQYAIRLIPDFDVIVVHVASPAEASLEANTQRKISAIQDIDAMIVAPLLNCARERSDMRIMFVPTHMASLRRRKRLRAEVPVSLFGPGFEPFRRSKFSETAAREGEIAVAHGHELLEYFLRQ